LVVSKASATTFPVMVTTADPDKDGDSGGEISTWSGSNIEGVSPADVQTAAITLFLSLKYAGLSLPVLCAFRIMVLIS